MPTIQLTQGEIALVDEDFELEGKWHVKKGHSGQQYAARTVLMHKVVWEKHHGPVPDGFEIDHINGNQLDNRLKNLRLCSHADNQHNGRRHNTHTSRFKGVCWVSREKKWYATITDHNRQIRIGYFISEEDAAHAYDAKAKELWGSFANLNFPE